MVTTTPIEETKNDRRNRLRRERRAAKKKSPEEVAAIQQRSVDASRAKAAREKLDSKVAQVVEQGAKGTYPEQLQVVEGGKSKIKPTDPIGDPTPERKPGEKVLDPERPTPGADCTVPNPPVGHGDVGRFGTCCSEQHAADCPRRVDHLVDPFQTVGPDRFITVECRAGRVLTKAQTAVDGLMQKLAELESPEQIDYLKD